jgi:WD40 repeat protein
MGDGPVGVLSYPVAMFQTRTSRSQPPLTKMSSHGTIAHTPNGRWSRGMTFWSAEAATAKFESGTWLLGRTGPPPSHIRRVVSLDPEMAVFRSDIFKQRTVDVWPRRRWIGHQASVRCLAIHGDLVVSGSYDTTARIWSISQGRGRSDMSL